MLKRSLGALLLTIVLSVLGPRPAQAQFRNNGFYLPQLGYLSLENLNAGDGFGSSDVGFFGVGGQNAVWHNLWLTYRFWVGFSQPTGDTIEGEASLLTTIHVIPGVRYNFLDEDYRPYAELGFHYVLFPYVTKNVPVNEQLGGQAMFGGPRLAAGFEWYFFEEMSLSAEVAGDLYLTIGSFWATGVSALVGYTVYY